MLIAKYRPIKNKDPLIPIVISVVIASILTVYPLSYDISAWRPFFMMMVMIFWSLCQPAWCGVWFSFTIGLFYDLLIDAPLGQNALAYVIITFIVRYLIRERRILTFLNLWLISILVTLAYVVFIWVTQVIGNVNYPMMRRLPPVISTLLLWPVVYYSLKRWRA